MSDFTQYPSIRSRWLDAEKTLLLADVVGPWTWEQAFAITAEHNAVIRTLTHDVYIIILFHPGARMIPQGMELANLRDLLRQDHPNERLVVIAGGHTSLKKLMDMVSRIYRLANVFMKYRFVYTLDEALEEVARAGC